MEIHLQVREFVPIVKYIQQLPYKIIITLGHGTRLEM